MLIWCLTSKRRFGEFIKYNIYKNDVLFSIKSITRTNCNHSLNELMENS